MDLDATTTLRLGALMAVLALVNAGLMAWLWRFPMVPDPTGRDPHGVSTAPRGGTNLHRAFGYVFLLVYVALLTEMAPRAWEYREASATGIAHGVLGVLAGLLLLSKIAVLRRFRRFGNRLPLLGGALAASTVVLFALAAVPAWTLLRPASPLSPELSRGRDAVARRCLQCHGASTIAAEREDPRKWDRITREMQDLSRRTPGKAPIPEDERVLATTYLSTFLSDPDDREDDDRRGRRGRGRDRGPDDPPEEGPAPAPRERRRN
ncbi:MAG: hypothetical protein KJ062_11615 [Thermoanaerobaculia bacterium]|nr:hypothetical protein [Thermoanaerobaculia bacterium]